MSLMPLSDIPHELRIADLRRWATMFFDLLEARGHETIPLRHSYYWSVTPADAIYDPTTEPRFDGLDDLFDNVRDVMSEGARPMEERTLSTLEDLAALLAYIGSGLPLRAASEREEPT